jgi:hypothetical protein
MKKKEKKALRSQKEKRLKPKAKAAKTECSDLGFRMVRFFLNRYNPIRDRDRI